MDISALWGAAWGGEGAPPLRATVTVAVEAKGNGSARVLAPVDLDAHARAIVRCVVAEALPVCGAAGVVSVLAR